MSRKDQVLLLETGFTDPVFRGSGFRPLALRLDGRPDCLIPATLQATRRSPDRVATPAPHPSRTQIAKCFDSFNPCP
jgi:hypothetical protein